MLVMEGRGKVVRTAQDRAIQVRILVRHKQQLAALLAHCNTYKGREDRRKKGKLLNE